MPVQLIFSYQFMHHYPKLAYRTWYSSRAYIFWRQSMGNMDFLNLKMINQRPNVLNSLRQPALGQYTQTITNE